MGRVLQNENDYRSNGSPHRRGADRAISKQLGLTGGRAVYGGAVSAISLPHRHLVFSLYGKSGDGARPGPGSLFQGLSLSGLIPGRFEVLDMAVLDCAKSLLEPDAESRIGTRRDGGSRVARIAGLKFRREIGRASCRERV